MSVLVVAFIGLALAKPWAGPVEPTPSAGLASGDRTPPPPSLQTTAPHVGSPGPSAVVHPLPIAFTTARPPSASSTWSGLTWRRLAPDDPMSLVSSVLRWHAGFVAVGWEPRLPATPVWTSTDGRSWEPLVFGTSTTFWPGLGILGVGEAGGGLVAIAEAMQFCGEPCESPFIAPVISWTSPDGRDWTPHVVLPAEWLANPPGTAPLVAVGPAGFVIASIGPGAHVATSADGSKWHLLPVDGFPARFALSDLRGTSSGYVAVGRWLTSGNAGVAGSLWSSDGRHWPAKPVLLPTSRFAGAAVGSTARALVTGPSGMIAVGSGLTAPAATLWWASSDGRRWRALPTFAPVGEAPCTGDGCGQQPGGALVGDGQRLVAIRGGSRPAAWVSSDARTWRGVAMSGDLPPANATAATLLPGGVIVSDGLTMWYGEATAR